MKCEVMLSIMNISNKDELIKNMKLNKCIIINQITKNIKTQQDDICTEQKFLSFKEKGLSKSRNKALKNATGDICILADDDVVYVDNYENIIVDAYEKYKDADVIAFVVMEENENKRSKVLKEGKLSFLKSMKLSSCNITFKRESIINNNICFDEKFGAGSTYPWGEDNIFLFDCKRKKLKMYYVAQKIADKVDTGTSTWDKSNTIEHFNYQGIIYYRMSKRFYWILILQFALRKKKIYGKELTFFQVLKAMFKGVKKYKKVI